LRAGTSGPRLAGEAGSLPLLPPSPPPSVWLPSWLAPLRALPPLPSLLLPHSRPPAAASRVPPSKPARIRPLAALPPLRAQLGLSAGR
jgi:hypothetical protein